MHNLQAERFYKPRLINGMMASADGPIKTFPLRGIKDSPPYMHDGRLLTLEDTVEFFNLISEVNLTTQEKADIVAFLRGGQQSRQNITALYGCPLCLRPFTEEAIDLEPPQLTEEHIIPRERAENYHSSLQKL